MSIALDELVRYWRGELGPDREIEVEEALFSDATTARRLDAIARLEEGIRALVATGGLLSSLTVQAVQRLQRAGMTMRTYELSPGQTAPCSIAEEDLVVVRLRGEFEAVQRVDVVMDGVGEGMPSTRLRADDVPIDRASGEVVLVYPGDWIRSLPRSQWTYVVMGDEHRMGEYHLDHTPSAS